MEKGPDLGTLQASPFSVVVAPQRVPAVLWLSEPELLLWGSQLPGLGPVGGFTAVQFRVVSSDTFWGGGVERRGGRRRRRPPLVVYRDDPFPSCCRLF